MLEILSQNALISLTLISISLSFVISSIYWLTMDKEKMEEAKEKSKELQKKMEKAR
ncbi:MAG: EMC3/TMCO1 family protein, partial [Candidatus Aenigmatarchaeota archaeon]